MNKKTFISYCKLYFIALRPFSLTLAFASTTYGIIAANFKGNLFVNNITYDVLLVALITIAGIASQAGANLINDYFEGSFKYVENSTKSKMFLGRKRTYFDIFVFLSGLAALGIAGLIGLYLVYRTNWVMLVIGIIGLVGSYAYTGEPFVYKRKALGVPLSFILMGPLMTFGSYYAISCNLSILPILISLPGSLLIPALMISNEMRDFKRDENLSLGTLTVKIGSFWSARLFEALLILMYISTIFLILYGFYPVYALISLCTLPLAFVAWNHVRKFERLSIPSTNKLHLVFNLIILLSLIVKSLI